MTEKLYKIKPLDWIRANNLKSTYSVYTIFGNMRVEYIGEGLYRWSYCFDEYYDEGWFDVDSLEEAKSEAEKFYLTRLLDALEEV